jgi:tetratricopeptide (TPR) repeat protein
VFNLRKLSAFFRARAEASPYERALQLLEEGAYAPAERAFTELLAAEQQSERVTILNKRGVARVHQNRRDEALQDFNAALQIDPQFPPSLVNVGNLLLEDGRLEEAILQYEAAVRSDDSYAVAHMNLSAAYKQAGRHAEAVREFRRAGRVEGTLFKKKTPR